MKTVKILIAGCFAFYFSSCTSDKSVQPVLVNLDSCVVPAGRLVTYTTDIKPILETYCTQNFGSCHQAGYYSGFDYTTYDGIKAEADNGKLLDRVLGPFDTGDKMPLSSSTGLKTLTACDTFKIHTWVLQGAPE